VLDPVVFWWVILWMVFWGVVGSLGTRRRYLARDLDTTNTVLVGAMVGSALGPVGLVPLWYATPRITSSLIVIPGMAAVLLLAAAFSLTHPNNICVTSGSFVASQFTNGVVIGIIYGFMALGLSLIFSILGVVSFAHGEFYMIGGMLVYYITAVWMPGIPPLVAILMACAVVFALGSIFERLFLTPMYDGRIDRPIEYGILITFGLAFTLQYFVQATAGANPEKVQRYIDFPRFGLPSAHNHWLIHTTGGSLELFNTVYISNPRFTASVVCILVLLALMYFLHRTWTGKALRAVSQDRDAAAIAGINPDRMNMQKAASYIPAYGMIVLTLTLLLKPTGLFGRRFASGAHGKF
jgi:branched-chain amino acid transport system permease protein